jgi:hypothetical protein
MATYQQIFKEAGEGKIELISGWFQKSISLPMNTYSYTLEEGFFLSAALMKYASFLTREKEYEKCAKVIWTAFQIDPSHKHVKNYLKRIDCPVPIGLEDVIIKTLLFYR